MTETTDVTIPEPKPAQPPEEERLMIKCVVAGKHKPDQKKPGDSQFWPVIVAAREKDYRNGIHRVAAQHWSLGLKDCTPRIVFDQDSTGFALLGAGLDWDTVPVVDQKGEPYAAT